MRRALALLGMVAAAALAACAPSTAGGGSGGAVLTGTFTLSGSVNGSGTISIKGDLGVGCSDLAQHGISVNNSPHPLFNVGSGTTQTIAGHMIYLDASVTNYHGPGDYDHSTRLTTGTTVAVVSVEVRVDDASTAAADYETPMDTLAPENMTVRADGSGTLTFSGLVDMNGNSNTDLAGSATWTCA